MKISLTGRTCWAIADGVGCFYGGIGQAALGKEAMEYIMRMK